MVVLKFRSPVTRPLYPPRGDKPRIADEFYVTQRFNDPDFYWTSRGYPGRTHNATDIGNGRCDYPIVAMAPGRVTRVHDNATDFGAPNNALGVRIDHGYGVSTEVWHLNSYALDVPSGTYVAAGRIVGYHGKTGLGQVCHAHIEAKVNGVRIDPEPLMFGGSLTVGEGEQDVIAVTGWSHVVNRRSSLVVNSWFRDFPATGDGSKIKIFPAGTALVPVGHCRGEAVGTNDQWVACALWVDATHTGAKVGKTVLGFIHSSVVAPYVVVEDPDTDCAPKVNTAITEERARWRAWLGEAPD